MDQSPRKELSWPQYEVIEVKNTLGAKALVPGNPKSAIANATKKAEAAVEQLSAEFPHWMKSESDRLNELRGELAKSGYNPERLDNLFTCAHDIKGQAQTFGYPVAAIVANLLCRLIEHAPDPMKLPLAVIDQHVDTIRAIVRQNLTGDGNAQTTNIINGLQVLDHTTLEKISKSATASA